jgi:hypothetical protein
MTLAQLASFFGMLHTTTVSITFEVWVFLEAFLSNTGMGQSHCKALLGLSPTIQRCPTST